MPKRTFVDAAGTEWEVCELPIEYPPEVEDDDDAILSSGVPHLVFASPRGIRMVSPVPADWLTCSEARLVEMMTLPPAPRRRAA